MQKTLIEPADVTQKALFAGEWYDAYWCRERPATRLDLLNSVARRMGDVEVLLAPVTSDRWVTRIHQIRSFFEQKTSWRLAKAERR